LDASPNGAEHRQPLTHIGNGITSKVATVLSNLHDLHSDAHKSKKPWSAQSRNTSKPTMYKGIPMGVWEVYIAAMMQKAANTERGAALLEKFAHEGKK
jgi:hypothetical protein